mmetsp:Transcript_31096/g.73295  ORF Transcript_31096/g.73295 Transcript_31096/m.73295 type:complete len:536 (-) Transcript_31096:475-2082(-)
MMTTEEQAKEEARALMQRLEAQFGDVALDLKMLGLDDEEAVANELAEMEEMEKDLVQSSSTSNGNGNGTNVADAEAAALMARLGAQFGDLDMTQLGLGLGTTVGDGGSTSVEEAEVATADTDPQIESEESSLADPTPEELSAWQASQFNKGREHRKQQQQEQNAALTMSPSTISIRERRKFLQEKREQQLVEEQVRLRFQQSSSMPNVKEAIASNKESGSILDLLGDEQSAFFSPENNKLVRELTSNEQDGDPEILQTSWKRLYASYEQGLGFLSMWNALRGYDGPTLMIMRTLPSASKFVAAPVTVKSNQSRQSKANPTACIGFYTTIPWVENTDFFGGDISGKNDADKAFLFSIQDDQAPNTTDNQSNNIQNNAGRIRFFPVKSKEEDGVSGGYMYCHPSTMPKRQNGKSFAVNGIGVGGRPTQPRFHLTETFEDCRCLTYDSSRTTKNGDLFAGEDGDTSHPFAQALYYFDVDEIEVWGVGGKEWIEHALNERENTRKQHIKQYQTVNKQMMWDDGTFAKRMTSKVPYHENR